jgi:hypothetical protein
MSQGFTKGTPIDTDGTLSLNSDIVVPSQKAVRTYVASQIGTPVTNVTASAPILSSGGVTPNISIPVATSLVNGYLTSTDWTTFNGKENVLTFSSPLSRTTNTISIPAATTSVNGYLTSTDWTTFNGKLSGSGTTNELAYFSAASTLSSLTTGTYPSLTELSYVKGVTSAIQTQLNAKVPSTRQLTINGTAYDLSADRSWTVTAAVGDLPEISISTANAREDDYAPTGWPGSGNIVKVIRINSTNTNYMMSLGGLASPSAGRIVTIYNASTANNLIIIENLSTSSTAANRFRMTGNLSYFLLPNRSVTFIYDGTYWTQMSASSIGGLDIFDEMTAGGSAFATGGSTGLYGFFGSGTGAGVRPDTVLNDGFGEISLSTGSTATGFAVISAQIRRNGGNNSFGGNTATNSIPYLAVGRIYIPTLATGAQDFRIHIGMNGTSSLPTNAPGIGYLWVYQGSTSTFWDVASSNVATTTTVTTSLAVTAGSWYWLGVYKPGGANIRDAVYFYSTNGVVYTMASKFVGTTGVYGGSPTLVLGSTVGITAKAIYCDWMGSSFNWTR